jgi:hypothetical protein
MSGPHENDRCPSCGATGDQRHDLDCRWVGNPERKLESDEAAALLHDQLKTLMRRGLTAEQAVAAFNEAAKRMGMAARVSLQDTKPD